MCFLSKYIVDFVKREPGLQIAAFILFILLV